MHDFDQEICISASVIFQSVTALLYNLQYILLIIQIDIKLKYKFLQGSYLEVQARLFTAVNGRMTRDSGYKLGKERF